MSSIYEYYTNPMDIVTFLDGDKADGFMQTVLITPLKNKLKNQLAYRTFGCLKKLATF